MKKPISPTPIQGYPTRRCPAAPPGKGPKVLDDAYADGRVANRAIDRLRSASRNPDEPFFMAVGFARPHLPFSAPEKYWALYDWGALPMPAFEDFPFGAPSYAVNAKVRSRIYTPIPVIGEFDNNLKRTLIHGYYASVSYMDAQVGRVIDELERLDLAETTIIVLWGDHGFHLGDHGSWTKHSNHEQANRIPLDHGGAGHHPARAAAPSKWRKRWTLSHSLRTGRSPTPETAQPLDGVSLVPVLKDPAKPGSETTPTMPTREEATDWVRPSAPIAIVWSNGRYSDNG